MMGDSGIEDWDWLGFGVWAWAGLGWFVVVVAARRSPVAGSV